MTMQTKTIGRMPTDHGPYDPNLAYGKKFQCSLFGCAWESLHDNNNTAPAVWDGGDTITPNLVDWKKVSGDYNAWLMNNDKPAQSEQYPFNGMGRVKLLKHLVEVEEDNVTVTKNLLYQDDFYKDGPNNTRVPNTNTVFEVPYEFELAEDITIPAGSILDFQGGSISAGGNDADTITGNDTGICADLVKIFKTDLTLAGTWHLKEWNVSWFGADGSSVSSPTDHIGIQAALDAANNTNAKKVVLENKRYWIAQTLQVHNYCELNGITNILIQEGTPCIMAVNCDAIHLVSNSTVTNEILQITLCNFKIMGNGYSGITATGDYNGIVTDGEGTKTIGHIYINNITVEYTNFAVYFKHDSRLPSDDSSVFHGIWDIRIFGCKFQRNKIGYFVDGNAYGSARGAWYNANSIVQCTITGNTIGGILVRNVGNAMNNVIDRCDIEGCGREYTLSDYETYGAFGVCFKNDNNRVDQSHSNIITNCYFEHNVAERTGSNADANKEYTLTKTRGGSQVTYTYPKGYREGNASTYGRTDVGTIVAENHRLVIKNNFFSYFFKAVSVAYRADVTFENNNLIEGAKVTDSYEVDEVTYTQQNVPVVTLYTHDSTKAGKIIVKENIFGSAEDNTLQYTLIQGYMKSGFSYESIVLPALHSYDVQTDTFRSGNKTLAEGCNVFVGSSPLTNFGLGITQDTSLLNLKRMYDWLILGSYNKTDSTICEFVGSSFSGIGIPVSSDYSNKTFPKIKFKGQSGTTFTANASGGILPLFNDAEFENITFTNSVNAGISMIYVTENCREIKFKNCTINIDTDSVERYLFGFMDSSGAITDNRSNDLRVVFENCAINRPGVRVFFMKATSLASGKAFFDFINCSVYPANVITRRIGTISERDTDVMPNGYYLGYEYYDTDNNKKIMWNGTAWVNVDGSSLN